MSVKDGDKIQVEYSGSLEDGTIFDSSEKHSKPLEFTVGDKQVIIGIDNAVKGMEKGEEKEVTIPVAEAYGENNPQLIQKVPRDQLPKEEEPKVGMILLAAMPNGAQMPVKIIEVTDTEVTMDMNHPLAGKILKFKLKILEISSGNEEVKNV